MSSLTFVRVCVCACGKVSSIMFSVSFKVTGLSTPHPPTRPVHTHRLTLTHTHRRRQRMVIAVLTDVCDQLSLKPVPQLKALKGRPDTLKHQRVEAAKRETSVNKTREQTRDYCKC
ncbi:Hypothetical predicted protein [Xyrichtys novacula]|uniref:Uncharacterized protein n=1 Tax=Xyrichtys novacula TaxID=13765 RepID=A0AAV1H081_XYRNO|nr:Hypothetical predicted protein [Xyrichtys novacula]